MTTQTDAPPTTPPRPPPPQTRARAKPLPPQERRSRIISAARPLLLTHGLDVTTKQLAEAAGVAEGTLFRVFESKEDLLVECARSAFDPTEHLAELDAIDPEADLEARLVALIESAQRHARQIMRIFVAFGRPADRSRLGNPRELVGRSKAQAVTLRVASVLEPDADRLRIPVAELVRLVGALSWISVHPMNDASPMTPEQLADVLLHGVLANERRAKPLDPLTA
ncbi:MAG: TetR/AcrR family transcriptional regulator [Dermatophilaceae bacterium]